MRAAAARPCRVANCCAGASGGAFACPTAWRCCCSYQQEELARGTQQAAGRCRSPAPASVAEVERARRASSSSQAGRLAPAARTQRGRQQADIMQAAARRAEAGQGSEGLLFGSRAQLALSPARCWCWLVLHQNLLVRSFCLLLHGLPAAFCCGCLAPAGCLLAASWSPLELPPANY